ncbi:MAG: hypothetical protein D6702_05100 [Planctomycetota bacterium]|nr:MAG: hypothetical protein D6702_05100 [Planctomycetota bacterium]
MSRLLLPLLLLPAVAAAAPPGEPVWSGLEATIARSTWIVRAEVLAARPVGGIGTHVEVKVLETLQGPSGLERCSYLTDPGRLVAPGEEEILFLRPPAPGGAHHRVEGRVGGRSPFRREKLTWLRRVLELRALPAGRRGKAFLSWYLEALRRRPPDWPFWRALAEIERLRRENPKELRALLPADALERAAEGLAEGQARRRLLDLARWRREGAGPN